MRLRKLASWALGLTLLPALVALPDERRTSGSDTARRAAPAEMPEQEAAAASVIGEDGIQDRWHKPGPRTGTRGIDPAVQQFWSERCVQQRRAGLPHTKDCDNPAYTGGAAPARPYPYRPYGRGDDWRVQRPYLPYRPAPTREYALPPSGSFRLPAEMRPKSR